VELPQRGELPWFRGCIRRIKGGPVTSRMVPGPSNRPDGQTDGEQPATTPADPASGHRVEVLGTPASAPAATDKIEHTAGRTLQSELSRSGENVAPWQGGMPWSHWQNFICTNCCRNHSRNSCTSDDYSAEYVGRIVCAITTLSADRTCETGVATPTAHANVPGGIVLIAQSRIDPDRFLSLSETQLGKCERVHRRGPKENERSEKPSIVGLECPVSVSVHPL
jgi:hypothetical protein